MGDIVRDRSETGKREKKMRFLHRSARRERERREKESETERKESDLSFTEWMEEHLKNHHVINGNLICMRGYFM